MDDRELLELAAKAAGVELTPMEVKNVTQHGDDRFIGYMTNPEQWQRGWFNPLTDDGDALRLAVQLKMHVGYSWDGCNEEYDAVIVQHGKIITEEQIGLFNLEQINETAATRRAIVRAAAEIGRQV